MKNRPNILWIVTTQWRGQACGYAGDANARTPRIDALAAESVNYAQAVTPHPFGPFARAALLTGVRSPENGVRDYFDALPVDSRTIAHDMRERGYATAFFGKWGVGRRDVNVPLVGDAAAKVVVPEGERGGFEFWEGFEGGFQLNDPWLHGTRLAEPVKFEGYQSEVLCQRVGTWFGGANEDERPWFCVVSLEAPHPPYGAPPADTESPQAESLVLPANVPRGGEVETKARGELAGYYAHIMTTDWAVGGLLDDLNAHAPHRANNTVVVFTSVHGDMHGAHGLFRKGWPQEESVRVPLLVRAPGLAARRDDAAVSLMDLPAMTRAWGEGRDWREERAWAEISMPSVVQVPLQCDRVWRGWRSRARKLVLDGAGAPWLFFDLERDPLELENLVRDPARAAEIAALARELG